jgi:hypothetical protein
VEETEYVETAEITDLPVLYPETRDDDDEPVVSVAEHDIPDLTVAVDDVTDDELIVSEWPAPPSVEDITSLEAGDEDTDTDASASGS